MKVLMVCLGNICRSPLAEGILKYRADKLELGWEVDSAGTLYYHEGNAPHPLSQKIALLHGIDISQQKSRPFKLEDMEKFDVIFAMAIDVMQGIKQIAGESYQEGKVTLLMDELYPGKGMNVPDPYYGPEHEYHEAFSLIDKACEAFIKKEVNKK
jgi:protein-tyrosine phosphatase